MSLDTDTLHRVRVLTTMRTPRCCNIRSTGNPTFIRFVESIVVVEARGHWTYERGRIGHNKS